MYIEGVKSCYRDALVNKKKNKVNVHLHNTFGGMCPVAAAKIRRMGKTTKGGLARARRGSDNATTLTWRTGSETGNSPRGKSTQGSPSGQLSTGQTSERGVITTPHREVAQSSKERHTSLSCPTSTANPPCPSPMRRGGVRQRDPHPTPYPAGVLDGSVDLDRGEDLPHEPVARIEADRARRDEEDQRGDRHVAEVEQPRHELCDLELGEEVED